MLIRAGLLVALAALASLGLSACSQNEQMFSPTNYVLQKMTREQMRDAIVHTAIEQGWRVDDRTPGLVRATFREGEREAEIEIQYNAERYAIRYRNSEQLRDEDSAFDEIKAPYNLWVKTLDQGIKERLEQIKPHQS